MLKTSYATSDSLLFARPVARPLTRTQQIAAVLDELPPPGEGGCWYNDLLLELIARYGGNTKFWRSNVSRAVPLYPAKSEHVELAGFTKHLDDTTGFIRFTRRVTCPSETKDEHLV